jgi:hypothetical protein
MTDACVHRPFVYEDANGVEHYGPECGNPATHVSCQPHVGALTCAEHKCRCAYDIGSTPPDLTLVVRPPLERQRIVAWLREPSRGPIAFELAARIEKGEHMSGSSAV